MSGISRLILLVSFANLAAAQQTCYYDTYGIRRCGSSLAYGARIGIGIGIAVLFCLIIGCIGASRRRRVNKANLMYINQSGPNQPYQPPQQYQPQPGYDPSYGNNYNQGNQGYGAPPPTGSWNGQQQNNGMQYPPQTHQQFNAPSGPPPPAYAAPPGPPPAK